MPAILLSTLSILLLPFLLVTNFKSLPLVYSFQLLPSLYRLLRPRLSRNTQQPTNQSLVSPHPINTLSPIYYPALPSLFRPHTTHTHCPIPEIDLNLHKSNSTFFTDADLSRARLLSHLLGPALASIGGMPILAAVQARFLREIRPFQRYSVSTRILAWDQRSVFTVTYFLKGKGYSIEEVDLGFLGGGGGGGPAAVLADEKLRKGVLAVLVSRYVVKCGRVTVSPVDVFKRAGLLVDEHGHEGDVGQSTGKDCDGSTIEKKGGSKICSTGIEARSHPKDEEVWSADRVEKMMGSAMAFIGECML
ncbi:hypothetical protein AbraIFM66951_005638 [Aspergillus brasiliensis]|uniref:Thioesterase domain-containing protein n=1 Tax=Aspergillus brasiliensis TaxID=319629 RepID=A0A9W5YYW3_9EURO|nr:hypothetical protein AbraCBS73388_001106 [Aspergillus brasiliensis]GKZ51388.1 hypothetical protein AbraIFM66951_005638 [Aspergillus brasiliensis]